MIYNLLALIGETTQWVPDSVKNKPAEDPQPSALTWVIFAVVMVIVVACILISQKKAASSIPKALASKYDIKGSQQFGANMLFVTEDKLVVQDNLKWFEFDPKQIKKIKNLYNGTMKQFEIDMFNEDGKLFKGPKVYGGGVAIKSTRSGFIYYHGGRNTNVEEQAKAAIDLIVKHFPGIEVEY